jgi:hypothetical protein
MSKIPLLLPVPDELPQPFPFGPPPPPDVREWYEDRELRPICFIVGVDLGQARDFSAIVINECNFATRTHYQKSAFESAAGELRREQIAHHRLRHVERVVLGTSYPDVIARVVQVMDRLPSMSREPRLVVDGTGCGRPVIDMMRKSQLRPLAVTITAGSAETIEGMNARVAKRILASTVAVALDYARLQVVADGPHVEVLRGELRAFKVKVNSNQNESFESWREADHDDLVLGSALAVWAGERLRQRHRVNPNWSLLDPARSGLPAR